MSGVVEEYGIDTGKTSHEFRREHLPKVVFADIKNC